MTENSRSSSELPVDRSSEIVANPEWADLPDSWRDTALTVVVPTYNEAENLRSVIDALAAIPLNALSILVVDDSSPDGTGDLAEELATSYNDGQQQLDRTGRMSVLHRTTKDGLGRAYVAGITAALEQGAEYVLQMDADGSHPADKISSMLGTALLTGAGVVVGSRYVSGGSVDLDWSWQRKLLSAFANFYVNRILGTRIRDITAGFNLWHKSVFSTVKLNTVRGSAYSFQVELKYRAVQQGALLVELPIHFVDRTAGNSKMDLSVQLESAWRPWQLRFFPER